ncbi:8-oxo-dGTPase [Scopulibacillus darangshiensis]|uniref:8-oxo-dGTPase n=1 Tax=Scopulibacillus darangshiensis TaxID=442528 RepID=A0A4V2SMB5_9BACL|nr:nucleoside triphosphatase YtkD [Scopulibacillus darangshiensis]TCP26636.1 8-oxo-dGTPase [Scopulibacillus darangshiensis]
MNDTYTFRDYYQNEVTFSFTDHPYSKDPKHVWIICRFHNQWLLTRHPRRGWEFPGGKVEEGETAEEAAVREVYEETGASVLDLYYIGQYKVDGKSGSIVKNVYYASISQIKVKDDYLETNGPVLVHDIPRDIKRIDKYSFMMKDDVLTHSVKQVKKQYLKASPE